MLLIHRFIRILRAQRTDNAAGPHTHSPECAFVWALLWLCTLMHLLHCGTGHYRTVLLKYEDVLNMRVHLGWHTGLRVVVAVQYWSARELNAIYLHTRTTNAI